jgi:two-component system, LytTR family, sensor histidine kinase AlgZ
MQGIIRQKPELPALPDLRNLGTILRILVAVNGAALAMAFAHATRPGLVLADFVTATGAVEPHLLVELALLWLVQPALARLSYGAGIAIIGALTVVIAVLVHIPSVAYTVSFDAAGVLKQVVLALCTVAGLLGYFHLRARALSPAITEARLQALQARIRPHFLFNSITAVLSLVRTEPHRAETALEDMAELFRVLMRDNRDLAPLADEVELCRQYLDLEKLRLGDRLEVDWNVKSMPGDALVPPLMLQPLLENAVYHGIEPSIERGTVSINIFLSRDEIHAILKNPYRTKGGGHHSGNKMALANVRERLALHFDAEASLDSRVTREGYEVHIRVPYRTASAEVEAPARREPTLKPGARRADNSQPNSRVASSLPALHHPEVSRA